MGRILPEIRAIVYSFTRENIVSNEKIYFLIYPAIFPVSLP